MIRILGISGSLRAGSFNTQLLKAASALAGPDIALEVATLHGIPLYDGDVETQGIPQSVRALKERVLANDALLLVTPEYNNSIPGVFKNAIDWLSRPPAEVAVVFGNRAVAVIGASPGGFGSVLAQTAWLPVLKTLGTRHWSGAKLMVSHVGQVFDAAGAIKDETLRKQVADFVQGFARFAVAGKSAGG